MNLSTRVPLATYRLQIRWEVAFRQDSEVLEIVTAPDADQILLKEDTLIVFRDKTHEES